MFFVNNNLVKTHENFSYSSHQIILKEWMLYEAKRSKLISSLPSPVLYISKVDKILVYITLKLFVSNTYFFYYLRRNFGRITTAGCYGKDRYGRPTSAAISSCATMYGRFHNLDHILCCKNRVPNLHEPLNLHNKHY